MDQHTQIPELLDYETRNKSKLHFRYYPSGAKRVMILIHGIAEDGKYLHNLAEYISTQHLAHVYTPDLRGYGSKPERRGDIEYIGQIEDDILDLIHYIEKEHPGSQLIMAGHSAGGGTAIRLAGKSFSGKIHAYLLLAPLIPNSPVEKKSGPDSYIQINMPKIIKLSILNSLGIKRFNHQSVMRINKPQQLLHGTETLSLSYRLLISRIPNMKYQNDLRAMIQPTLVLIGENDEVFRSEQYKPLFAKYNKAQVEIILDQNHDGILDSSETHEKIAQWMKTLK